MIRGARLILIAVIVGSGACSAGDGGGSSGSLTALGESTSVSVSSTGASIVGSPTSPPVSASEAPEVSTDLPPPVSPEPTGVPGLAGADPWCAAWAVYAGTMQMLAVGASFGEQDEQQLAIAEIYAAPAVLEALDVIEQTWPAELSGELPVVIDGVLGPMQRRVTKAVDAGRASGMTDSDLDSLGAAWMRVLAERDPEDPAVPRPSTGGPLDAVADQAAVSFLAAVPGFSHDPSLLVAAVDYSATKAYLATTCPDLATSGVGDAI